MKKRISIEDYLVTDYSLLPKGVMSIDIQEPPINSGKFGFIYECIAINGLRPQEQVLVKLLKTDNKETMPIGYSTIVKLQQRVIGLSNGIDLLKKYPVFKGFPGISFKGHLDGKPVWGFCATNLLSLGFISMDRVLDDDDSMHSEFSNLSIQFKFRFCFHLAYGFQLLSQVNYVHADINPKNVFVNLSAGELAIIDYDGGGILDNPDDDTLTLGKLEDGEWLAPEIYEAINECRETKMNKYCDQWSTSIAFHYLLFGFEPFFFVKERSKKCKEEYLKRNRLYPINTSDDTISENAYYLIPVYEKLVKEYIPLNIHQELIKNFESGFNNPRDRTQYSKWVKLFAQTQSLPVIEFFRPNKEYIFADSQVKLSWKVSNANKVLIDNQIGDVTGKNEIIARLHHATIFNLKAESYFGDTQESVTIEVFPKPVIENLKIPKPNFEINTSFPVMFITSPDFNLLPQLEPDQFFKAPIFNKPYDRLATIKPLYQKIPVVWSISQVFNKVKQVLTSRGKA